MITVTTINETNTSNRHDNNNNAPYTADGVGTPNPNTRNVANSLYSQ